MKYFIIYIVIVNFVSLLVYGLDKWLAKRKSFRISERFLFLLSLFGGALGALSGMFLFRHKTKKLKFYLWNGFMLLLWSYLLYKFMEGRI